jgi:hypothetical protein
MIGSNLQATVQVGGNNYATTSQTAANIANASVTAQFGFHNSAVTVQH